MYAHMCGFVCIYEVWRPWLLAFTVLFSETLDFDCWHTMQTQAWGPSAVPRRKHFSGTEFVWFLMRKVITKKHFTGRSWTFKRRCESNKRKVLLFLADFLLSPLVSILFLFQLLLCSDFPKYLQPAGPCRGLKNTLCAFLKWKLPHFTFIIVMCLFHRYF